MLNDSGLVRKHHGAHLAVGPGQAVDPICQEVVDPTDASLTITRKGKRIHFCSAQCRDEYYAREKYEHPAPGPQKLMPDGVCRPPRRRMGKHAKNHLRLRLCRPM